MRTTKQKNPNKQSFKDLTEADLAKFQATVLEAMNSITTPLEVVSNVRAYKELLVETLFKTAEELTLWPHEPNETDFIKIKQLQHLYSFFTTIEAEYTK